MQRGAGTSWYRRAQRLGLGMIDTLGAESSLSGPPKQRGTSSRTGLPSSRGCLRNGERLFPNPLTMWVCELLQMPAVIAPEIVHGRGVQL